MVPLELHWSPASVLLVDSMVIVSKALTASETMLNARIVRTWITSALGQVVCSSSTTGFDTKGVSVRRQNAVSKHMVAVSMNLKVCPISEQDAGRTSITCKLSGAFSRWCYYL